MNKVEIIPVKGLPLVDEGFCVGEAIVEALARSGERLRDGDIIVVAHSIVSRSEGRRIRLSDVKPSPLASKIAELMNKDPRHVEVVLQNSRRIVRMGREVVICETEHGFVCANAGVDASNSGGAEYVITLPIDPDKSAERIRNEVKKASGIDVAVVISDTFGRPFRKGAVNVAVGCSGINPLRDRRGEKDLYGRTLLSKVLCIADELASAAELVMGEGDEGIPAAVIRGYSYDRANVPAKAVVRNESEDLFR
ncbi:MAG: coenzyme F420-0:L-glutamate ligase [Candidatus Caldarchaeum sp.]|nr:coenzyme F420-0:L-glutamate ligase [Candidatus Caldarchaeum sp.]